MEEEWLASAATSTTMQSAEGQPAQQDEWASLLNAQEDDSTEKPAETSEDIVDIPSSQVETREAQADSQESSSGVDHDATPALEPSPRELPTPIATIKNQSGHGREESFSRSRASVGLSLADAVEDEDELPTESIQHEPFGEPGPVENHEIIAPEASAEPSLFSDQPEEANADGIEAIVPSATEPSMDNAVSSEVQDDEWQRALADNTGHEEVVNESNDEWARAMAETADTDLNEKLDDSILRDEAEIKEDGVDEWARALGGDSESKPKGNAFDEIFGDGAFLEDEDGLLDDNDFLPDDPPPALQPSHPQTMPIPIQNNPPQHAYATRPQPTTSNIKDSPKVGPMKFFEELPVTQVVRSRKPRQQQVFTPPASTPPPPPGQGPPSNRQQVPPPSNQVQQGGYAPLRPADRLDPFPPQPSVPPAAPTQMLPNYSTSPSSGQSQLPTPQQRPSANARYSPAPVQPTPPTNKYSSASAAPPLPTQTSSLQHNQPPPSSTLPSLPPQPSSQPSSIPPPPQANSRYSPAPPTQPSRSVSSYTSRDAATAPPRPPSAHKFAPRTSSPLAYHQQRSGVQGDPPDGSMRPAPPRESSRSFEYNEPLEDTPAESPSKRYSPSSSVPTSPSRQPPAGRRTSYAPADQPASRADAPLSTASQFASNKQSFDLPRTGLPVEPNQLTQNASSAVNQQVRPPPTQRGAAPSEDINFIPPEDELVNDPLQRWKGRPIFYWNPSGAISSSFPKRVPRFGAGGSAPMMKSFPGDIKLQKAKDVVSVADGLETFPGPLRNKSKKKDVITWLSSRVEKVEGELQSLHFGNQPDHDVKVKLQEKLLLLQILKTMVENDGVLGGNSTTEASIRSTLLACVDIGSNDDLSATTSNQPEAVDSNIVNNVRQLLLQGDREKAVWSAADGRHWGHALLISSTIPDKTIWKQVVQEFVRKEVRQSGSGAQSMAALYEVYAGNWEESVDELVPASARAGFQMMSTSETPGSKQDAKQGLDKWRETLSLIVSNRSPDDENGLLALGKLLTNYGRVEAAHTCYLFCKSAAKCGGADDPNTHFTLVGADVSKDGVHDIENVLLSEVYEFATNLASTSGFHFMAHLQAYKLHHANVLAESGFRNEAQQYCEAIAAAFKATTKLSPYYHATLISQVDELSKRLLQTPKDGKSGWMSKPSIEKVSGSMWAKFNSFVAGDDTEKDASPSGEQAPTEYGPFAGLTGGTPTISRSGSTTDLGAMHYPPRSSSFQSGATNSRYAPGFNGGSTSRDYSPHPLQQSSRVAQQSYSGYGSSPETSSNYGPMMTGNIAPYAHLDHLEVSSQRSVSSSAYEPYVPSVSEDYASSDRPVTQDSRDGMSYLPPTREEEETEDVRTNGYAPSFGGYAPPSDDLPASTGYDPSAGGYEPPASSYQPYEPDQSPENSADEKPKKKKNLFDDDDGGDLSGRSAAPQGQQRSENDRKAEEAFRKAAEADAARDAQAKKERRSSSWFGGFFGGGAAKKDPNAPVVHKAKLGEENSFYYDTELKKWVNKKAQGDSADTPAAPTPPPPRAGPPSSRHSSGSGPPPVSAGLPPSGPPLSKPPQSMATPPTSNPGYPPSPAMAAVGGPPSRTDTPQSEAGSEGVPPAGLGLNLPPGGPPSRPTTSMSNASSIDDLIGVPGARKAGGAKKGKKGARYVDVMGQK